MARSSHAGWELAAGPGFTPRDVPEIAAGYWWDAANTTGFGTPGFRVLEGNGHSTFDLVQATVANQPTLLTEAGGQQFRMRNSANANPSVALATAGTVKAGWTGPTYLGIWLRIPDASGDITGIGDGVFSHSLTTGNQRRLNSILAPQTPDRIQSTSSDDGILHATYNPVATSPFDGNYKYIEEIFDPALSLGGSSPGNVWKYFANFSQLTFTSVPSAAPASLFDGTAQIFVGAGFNFQNADTLDWSFCAYANGIPSLANRKRLANFRNPSGVLL